MQIGFSADLYECKQLALQASGGTANKVATNALIGGAVGAAGGAALGALAGNAGRGAAYGAAIGGIGAGTQGGVSAESQYKRAYTSCMRNRGHNVVN